MKIWVTKYALVCGIEVYDTDQLSGPFFEGGWYGCPRKWGSGFLEPDIDFFDCLWKAQMKAREMRDKEIEQLEKRIEELKEFDFGRLGKDYYLFFENGERYEIPAFHGAYTLGNIEAYQKIVEESGCPYYVKPRKEGGVVVLKDSPRIEILKTKYPY